jgi:TatD DNase family protein
LPAIALSGFEKLRALCAVERGLFPAYGLHPLFLSEHNVEHLDELEQWIAREKPVAVGECGLDFYVPDLDADTQRTYFERQLKMAHEYDLPVILHARRALDDVTAAIRRVGNLRGVVHSFSGSVAQARQLWKLGFHIGIGGPVTYERAHRLRNIVATMPLEFLLLETDSPDQPLHGFQGKRNEPARLVDICETIATLRGVGSEEIANATSRNCEKLFGLN